MIRISLLLFAIACDDGDKEDNTGPSCKDTEHPIGLDDDTPLGFTARQIADLVTPPYAGVLTWADGATTGLDVVLTPDGEAWFIDSEVVEGTGDTQPAIWPICEDRVAISAAFTFNTDDGAFAESWSCRPEATEATSATWSHPLDLDALEGTFDLVPFVESTDYDELRAWIDGVVTAPGSSTGVIAGQASGEEDCDPGDTCVAWAENVDVGTWGSIEER
jgi:hypothetical protein